jgi:hypothetical protein
MDLAKTLQQLAPESADLAFFPRCCGCSLVNNLVLTICLGADDVACAVAGAVGRAGSVLEVFC